MVSNHTPRVYATVTAHVNRDLSPRLCHGSCLGMLKGPAARSAPPGTDRPQQQHEPRSLLPHAASWHSGLLIPDDGEQGIQRLRKARNAPKGKKSMTVSGNRRQMDPFIGCCLSLLCQFLFFFNHICVSYSVYEKTRVCLRQMSGPR